MFRNIFLTIFILVMTITKANANYFVISNYELIPKQKSYCNYYIYGPFNDYDRALYLYEEILLRNKQAYLVRVKEPENINVILKYNCLKACLPVLYTLQYPKNFNAELFIADYLKLLRSKEKSVPIFDLLCPLRNFEDFEKFKLGDTEEVFVELYKFLKEYKK